MNLRPRDGGMVTAELAMCLPVLVLLVGFAVGTISAFDERTRLQDAALAAARAYARGDADHALALANELAPGSTIDVATSGDEVTAVATRHVAVLGVRTVTVSVRAVAALEPGIAP